MGPGVIELAKQLGIDLPPEANNPHAEITPEEVLELLREICRHFFPRLGPSTG
jgi:hypothetical protein